MEQFEVMKELKTPFGAVLSLCVLSALVVLAPPPAVAQEGFSGLEGTVLTLDSDRDETLGSLIGTLLGGGDRKEAGIEEVEVVDDQPGRLVVEVTWKGFDGATLRARAEDDDRHHQREVRQAETRLEGEGGSELLVLELDEGVAEGTEFESGYLRLEVVPAGRPLPQRMSFRLPKRWHRPVSAENVVVQATLEPVGSAARLPKDRPTLTIQHLPPVMKVPAFAAGAKGASTTGARPTEIKIDPKLTRQLMLRKAGPVEATEAQAAKPQAQPQKARPQKIEAQVMMAQPRLEMQVAEPKKNEAAKAQPQVAAKALPARAEMVQLHQFRFGVKKEDADRGAQGPGPSRIDLLEGLRSEVPLAFDAILNLRTEVFQDRNPASGVFYYLPNAYRLEWDPDAGYGMRMLYAAATEEGAAGDVLMATRLSSGVTTREASLAHKLLQAYKARHGTPAQVRQVRPLPLAGPPAMSLAGGLANQFAIPAETISINAISDALGAVDVSWITDPITKENIQIALTEDVGLNGVVAFEAAGGQLAPVGVPVEVKLAEPGTFGQLAWDRDGWRNRTPYPVHLTNLHALMIQNNVPIIYSWKLGDVEVPSEARLEWDASSVPRWLDTKAERMWVDYRVERDCRPCDEAVMAAITSGVTAATPSQLTFRTLTPLADTGAVEVGVRVRSRYFHPRNRELVTQPLLPLTADMQEFTTGPVYLVDRQPGEEVQGDPLFEYQLELLMPDGRSHRGQEWIPVHDLRVNVGSFQVEEALGFLPGGDGGGDGAGESP